MDTLIKCTKCGNKYPQSNFYKDKQKVTGYRPDCKSCNKKKCVEWARKNKDKRKYIMLKHATGLTKEQYIKLLQLQDSKCYICKRNVSELSTNLHVDHCHTTHIVRGLLCYKCNVGLGYYNDDINLLKNAISYLESNLSTENINYKK